MNKKLRFDVFKRDAFVCQYCGRRPPEVVLEVDHIFPKSKGGKDELVNLITSCFDCNRGKGATEINKVTRPDIAKINAEIEEKRTQLKEYHKFLKLEANRIESDVIYICDFYTSISGESLDTRAQLTYKQFLRYFDKYKICEAIEIAFVNNAYDILTYSYGVLHKWRKSNG